MGVSSLTELASSLPESATRILIIAAVTLGAHLGVVVIRRLSQRLLRSVSPSRAKVQTLTGFATSVLVFAIYFVALGFVLLRFLGA